MRSHWANVKRNLCCPVWFSGGFTMGRVVLRHSCLLSCSSPGLSRWAVWFSGAFSLGRVVLRLFHDGPCGSLAPSSQAVWFSGIFTPAGPCGSPAPSQPADIMSAGRFYLPGGRSLYPAYVADVPIFIAAIRQAAPSSAALTVLVHMPGGSVASAMRVFHLPGLLCPLPAWACSILAGSGDRQATAPPAARPPGPQ